MAVRGPAPDKVGTLRLGSLFEPCWFIDVLRGRFRDSPLYIAVRGGCKARRRPLIALGLRLSIARAKSLCRLVPEGGNSGAGGNRLGSCSKKWSRTSSMYPVCANMVSQVAVPILIFSSWLSLNCLIVSLASLNAKKRSLGDNDSSSREAVNLFKRASVCSAESV